MGVSRRRFLQAGAVASAALIYATAGSGITADGVVDDAAALQDRLDSLASSGGTMVVGLHFLSRTLRPPAGVTIRGGDDRSGFVLPRTSTFAAITVDGVDRVLVERLRVTSRGRRDPESPEGQAAVSIRGGAANTVIRDVWADGLHDGFRTDGGLGETPGVVRDVVFERCRATESAVFGFRLDDVDGLDMAFCSSAVSGLDGVKLRKNTRNVTITGGRFTGAVGGDGLDGYAGARSLTIQGSEFSGNGVNGLTLKTDELNRTEPESYGIPRAITVTGVRCTANTGNGLWIGRGGDDDDPSIPLLSQVSVTGGVFDGNGAGIVVRARSVSLSGVQVAGNGSYGIRIEPSSLDVVLTSPLVAGNGREDGSEGISIAGRGVQVLGGMSLGADADAVTSQSDLAGAAPTQRFGIRIEESAAQTLLVGPSLRNNAEADLSDASEDGAVVYPGAGGRAVDPGRATGPDAAVINAVVQVLRDRGLMT